MDTLTITGWDWFSVAVVLLMASPMLFDAIRWLLTGSRSADGWKPKDVELDWNGRVKKEE